RPGVPGTAHGRARVFSSRRYGRNVPSKFGSVANDVEMSGSVETSGRSHGSDPFARYASESRYTGERYFNAMRHASIAASKQSDGDIAATTGIGDSELRPNSTISRSPCSGFVG